MNLREYKKTHLTYITQEIILFLHKIKNNNMHDLQQVSEKQVTVYKFILYLITDSPIL